MGFISTLMNFCIKDRLSKKASCLFIYRKLRITSGDDKKFKSDGTSKRNPKGEKWPLKWLLESCKILFSLILMPDILIWKYDL